jgi:hypothetical protein
MNKNRVALYLGGVFLLTVVMAVALHRNSDARTRGLASESDSISYFEPQQPASAQPKVKEEFSASCNSKEDIVKSVPESSQVVRIKFTDCQQFSKKSPLYAVKNLTNGYDGQVFRDQNINSKSRMPANTSTQLSTDYIQLQNGENIIELEISLNDGQKINKKIRIHRQ